MDEVGRGCLAGPVVTAAVVLPELVFDAQAGPADTASPDAWWTAINDSKLVAPPLRERLAALIQEHAQVRIAWCSSEEIDRWNILHAAMIAMRRALAPLAGAAQTVLVDGHLSPFEERFQARPNEALDLGFTHVETLVKGDQRSVSIAAASIVAKVFRDRWMGELDATFPGYDFARHKGYSTAVHHEALRRLGPSAIHRMSFAPLRSILCNGSRDGEQSEPLKD